MILSTPQTFVILIVVTAATIITRFLPFVLFKNSGTRNSFINYLGKVLPFSAIGLLVVYCLKDINFFKHTSGIPEMVSVAFVAIIHYWKENTLLSIGIGTALYMILVQLVFV
ncbi:MAG: AzlD domain-containing protein [Firmicutes bacterium]|nr:AzlD domain-containing protein [Bacillota bacterium]